VTDAPTGPAKLRLDKWLWYARFFKTRTLAARQVSGGHLRINGDHARKPSQPVGPGDVLTFVQAREVRVVRIVDLGARRGPATEARALYDDLTPARPVDGTAETARVGARPTKRDRRALDRLRGD
jgi:ribosome-associated heat shock protein Hsp15